MMSIIYHRAGSIAWGEDTLREEGNVQPKAFFNYFLTFITGLALVFSMASPASGATNLSLLPNLAGLLVRAQSTGSVRVIVMFDLPFQPEGKLGGTPARIDQRDTIEQTQAGLLSRLSGYDPALVKRFSTIPGMALSVDADGLAQLAADGAIASIEPDRLAAPDLAESVPLIGAAAAQASGFIGAGQVVAVLDTGVDKNHPFLNGRVVSEACYSTTDSSYLSMSICPGGASRSILTDSALPYASGVCPSGKCDHGTHVAGIIAGNATTAYNHNGVAPGAQLIAIQVFSRFNSTTNCRTGAPCVLSFESDQILGLERVYALRMSYAIASVNMSLGGGKYTSQSDCDGANKGVKEVIDNLRSVGIATVIASGNDGYTDGLSAPGCISTAISVGSTEDGSGGITADAVSSYTNSAPFLSFLAPGDLIYSSIPGNSYKSMRGTSMASPYVAGAWALVKSRYPGYTVSQVAALLTSGGKPITDLRNGVIIPRIKLDQILGITFSVSGQVKLGGSGLAGVTLSDGSGHAATTDASGNYSIVGLSAGSFTITPTKAEYTFTPPTLSIVPGANQSGKNFTAAPALYSILGQVTLGGSGLPAVALSDGFGHSALTGASGNYSFTSLPAGKYTITPSDSAYIFSPVNGSVQVGPDQSGISFAAVQLIFFYFPLVQYAATP